MIRQPSKMMFSDEVSSKAFDQMRDKYLNLSKDNI